MIKNKKIHINYLYCKKKTTGLDYLLVRLGLGNYLVNREKEGE